MLKMTFPSRSQFELLGSLLDCFSWRKPFLLGIIHPAILEKRSRFEVLCTANGHTWLVVVEAGESQ